MEAIKATTDYDDNIAISVGLGFTFKKSEKRTKYNIIGVGEAEIANVWFLYFMARDPREYSDWTGQTIDWSDEFYFKKTLKDDVAYDFGLKHKLYSYLRSLYGLGPNVPSTFKQWTIGSANEAPLHNLNETLNSVSINMWADDYYVHIKQIEPVVLSDLFAKFGGYVGYIGLIFGFFFWKRVNIRLKLMATYCERLLQFLIT